MDYYYYPNNLGASLETDAGTPSPKGRRAQVQPAGDLIAVKRGEEPETIYKADGTPRYPQRVSRAAAVSAFGRAAIERLANPSLAAAFAAGD